MEFLMSSIGFFSFAFVVGAEFFFSFGLCLSALLASFFSLSIAKTKKEAEAELEKVIFLDESRYFAQEEVRPHLSKFPWVPIRKQKKTVEELDILKQLTKTLKDSSNSLIVLSGEGGSGKTKLLHELAKKHRCAFANWNLPQVDKGQILAEYKGLPSSVKYIILDDTYRHPRKAVQFCLDLLPAKAKLILASRNAQELIKIIKESRWQATSFSLSHMLNLPDLLESSIEPWINSDIKHRLISIANGNPGILCLSHEFIDLLSHENMGFDVLEFLKSINDKMDLYDTIYCHLHEKYGLAAIAVIARAVICNGLSRNEPFCKNNVKIYTKLSSLNYFYVKNDELFFKPAILGEYISKRYYFHKNKISAAFHNLIKDANETELQDILTTLIAFYKENEQPIYKQAAMFLLTSAKNNHLSDEAILNMVLLCDDELKDSVMLFQSIPDVLTLEIGRADYDLINRFAIFCAKNNAYDCAARWWGKLLEVPHLQNNDAWATALYNNLGLASAHQKEFDEAIEWYQLAHEKYEMMGNSLGIIQSLTNLAKLYQKKNDLPRSIELYNKSIDQYKKLNDASGAARAFMDIGRLAKLIPDMTQAQENYMLAAEWYQKTDDKKGLAQAYGNLGIIAKAKNELSEAINYFHKTLDAMEKIGDLVGIAQTHNNLALTYQEKGDESKAIKYFHEALEKFRQINDDKNVAQTYQNLALIYKNKENYDEAIDYFRRALAEYESLANKKAMVQTLHNLGFIHQAKKEWEKAIVFFQRAIKLLQELGTPNNKEQIYENLGIAYQSLNRYDEAIEAFEYALDGMEQRGDLDSMAQTNFNLGLIHYNVKNYQEALTLFNQILFFFLKKGSMQDIKKVQGVLSDIQKEMKKALFSRFADGALSYVTEHGIKWGSLVALTSQDVQQILNEMKKKKKARLAHSYKSI